MPETVGANPRGIADPWDHNGECLHCDELGMHRADCPWLLAVIARVAELEAEVALLQPAHNEATFITWDHDGNRIVTKTKERP
jgi:hypothetical protein